MAFSIVDAEELIIETPPSPDENSGVLMVFKNTSEVEALIGLLNEMLNDHEKSDSEFKKN